MAILKNGLRIKVFGTEIGMGWESGGGKIVMWWHWIVELWKVVSCGD